MENYRSGFLVIILSFILLFSYHNLNCSNVTGQNLGHSWHSEITQSNTSWPELITYQEGYVFYQDFYLECAVNQSLSNTFDDFLSSTDYELTVNNGVIWDYNDNTRNYYYWRDWESLLEGDNIGPSGTPYTLKPLELDRNFEMTLTIVISNGTMELYTEEHTFWIIGEPEVISGIDFDSGIMTIYIFIIIISIITVAVVHGIIYHSSKGKR